MLTIINLHQNLKKFISTILLACFFIQSCNTIGTENEIRSIQNQEYKQKNRFLEQNDVIKINPNFKREKDNNTRIEKKIIHHKNNIQRTNCKKIKTKKINKNPLLYFIDTFEGVKNQLTIDKISQLTLHRFPETVKGIIYKKAFYKLQEQQRFYEHIDNKNIISEKKTEKPNQIKLKENIKNETSTLLPVNLPVKFSKSKKYAPATVDFSLLEALYTFQTLARGNYPVKFFPAQNRWMAEIVDNLTPNFTRTIVLPVLYPVHENKYIYTIENILSNAREKDYKHLINIIFPENSPQKQGLVYIGEKMGLMGGGFWSSLGRICARIVVGALVAAATVGTCGAGLAAIGVIAAVSTKAVLIGAAIGGGIGLIGGTTSEWARYKRKNARDNQKSFRESEYERLDIFKRAEGKRREEARLLRKKEERTKMENEEVAYRNIEKNLLGKADTILEKLSYKNILNVLSEFSTYESSGTSNVNNMNSWKSRAEFWDDHKHIAFSSIDKSENFINSIDQFKKDAKDKARAEALSYFNKDLQDIKKETPNISKTLSEFMKNMLANTVSDDSNNISKLFGKIGESINKLKEWLIEPALFEEDRKIIEANLRDQKIKVDQLSNANKIVEFAKRDVLVNPQLLAEIFSQSTECGCFKAIATGNLDIIKYYLECDLVLKPCVNVNCKNKKGATLLHEAVKSNNIELVKLLISKGADLTISDDRKSTPIDLAMKNGNTAMMEVLKGG